MWLYTSCKPHNESLGRLWSRSHCHVFRHALHALQYATNKHLSINRRFVFIGKIPTVKDQKIKSVYKTIIG